LNSVERAPALSVLICTRNRPENLRRAVVSILANSFSDFELIVIDQSTDARSAQVMAAFNDLRIRYFRTTISRKIAIRAARADIVVFTEDYCICDRQWLATIRARVSALPSRL
jgi:glycosyltransferase involved in cell wall biosynthesis